MRVLILAVVVVATVGFAAGESRAQAPASVATTTPPGRQFRLAFQVGLGALTQLDSLGSAHNQGDLVGELSLRAPNDSGWQPHLKLIWGSLVPAGLPPVGIRVITVGATRRWEGASGGAGWIVPYVGGGVGLYSTPFATRGALSADAGLDLPLARWLSLVANASFALVLSGQTKPMFGTLTIGAQLSTS